MGNQNGVALQKFAIKCTKKFEVCLCSLEKSKPLAPMNGVVAQGRGKFVNRDRSDTVKRIRRRQGEKSRFHVDEYTLRMKLHEPITAHRTVGNGNRIVHDITVVIKFLAGSLDERNGNLPRSEFGQDTPVEGVSVPGFEFDTVQHERNWFAINVADQGVVVGDVPVTSEAAKSE